MDNLENLDKELQELVKLRNKLGKLKYSDTDYDEIEEQLHDKEDDFVEKYGNYLEEALHTVHDEYCPDNDVLLPIAYLAKKYIVTKDNQYSVPPNAGVFVDADDYPGNNTRLVLLPNPPRFELLVGKDKREVVWSSNGK